MQHYLSLMFDPTQLQVPDLQPGTLAALCFPKVRLPNTEPIVLSAKILADSLELEAEHLVFTMEVQYPYYTLPYRKLNTGAPAEFLPQANRSSLTATIRRRWGANLRHYVTLAIEYAVLRAGHWLPGTLPTLEDPQVQLWDREPIVIAGTIVEDRLAADEGPWRVTLQVEYEEGVVPYRQLHAGTPIDFILQREFFAPLAGQPHVAATIDNRWEVAARKEDWQNQAPVAAHRQALEYQRVLSVEEYHWLILGEVPRQMEDKWFIYFSEGHLYYHRSWTGICIYELELMPHGEGAAITQAWGYYENPEVAQIFDIKLLTQFVEFACRAARAVHG